MSLILSQPLKMDNDSDKAMFAEGIIHGTTSPPTRKHIAEWAIHVNNTLTETIIKKFGDMVNTVGFHNKIAVTLCNAYFIFSIESFFFFLFVLNSSLLGFRGGGGIADVMGGEMSATTAHPLFLWHFCLFVGLSLS